MEAENSCEVKNDEASFCSTQKDERQECAFRPWSLWYVFCSFILGQQERLAFKK